MITPAIESYRVRALSTSGEVQASAPPAIVVRIEAGWSEECSESGLCHGVETLTPGELLSNSSRFAM